MKEETPTSSHKFKTNFSSFAYLKNIRSWQDFLSTLKTVHFDESLNYCPNDQIEHFWQQQLESLSKETQKICILVPMQVKAKISYKLESNAQLASESQSKYQGQKIKGKKNSSENKVFLDKRVVQIAMDVISKHFKQLSYDYTSLFIGNQKQLLIYRDCYAIESYIDKYRLPNTFKQPFAQLQGLTNQYLLMKVQRNIAISTFNQKAVKYTTRQIDNLDGKIAKAVEQFKSLWVTILLDFKQKPKCKNIIVNHVNVQLIERLRPLSLACGADIIDRYSECELDEIKDIMVIKLEDPRLQRTTYQPDEQTVKIEYQYISLQRQPESPLDIRNLQFIGIDLKKQCYSYHFYLQNSNQSNMPEGLFIRSQPGDSAYELTIELKPKCKDIRVDIYPYREGKSVYQIYTWNMCGFTKSTDKIVLFNEMPYARQGRAIKDYNICFLGKSNCGLRYCEDNNEDEVVVFKYNKKYQKARRLDMCNSALMCNALGQVATWGEIYYPSQEQASHQQNQNQNFKIQHPSIALSQKCIRKVSCGASFTLMLSIFGQIYSMGINEFGQLGLGHLQRRQENYYPKQIYKFTNDNSPFIVDVHASVSGSSFALNSKGELYRWGKNQIEQTAMGIEDRFGSIINYSATPIIYRCCFPTKVNKKFLREPIKQVISGDNFYFALAHSGALYGWGECKNLGINWLQDKEQRIVIDIVNPIQVMKNIQSLAVGYDHVVATRKDGTIIGWGDVSSFSNSIPNKFAKTPIDLTEEYNKQQGILLKGGYGYTAILNQHNQIKIMGKRKTSLGDSYKVNGKVIDMVCGIEQFIGVLYEQ